jgi:hypothetical protein
MTRRLPRLTAAAATLLAGLGALSACTPDQQSTGLTDPGPTNVAYRLVAFDSCDEALTDLRTAARASVGPYGLPGMYGANFKGMAVPMEAARGAADSVAGTAPMPAVPGVDYSGTNTHEAGVDEPDLVKTDGRRIVTVSGGMLRVIDAATQHESSFLNLMPSGPNHDAYKYMPGDLLLFGDRALVLINYGYWGPGYGIAEDATIDKPATPIYGPQLILVDLSGQPRILSQMRVDGALVDARQVGDIARVVIRSSPRITFPYLPSGTDAKRVKTNQGIIAQAKLDAWLPRIQVTDGGSTRNVTVDCDAISRPAHFTGASMLTVLSFDLGAPTLDDGMPTTLVADGDTVYSNGPSLYISSDQRWRAIPMGTFRAAAPVDPRTEIYKFDTSSRGRPRFVAGGVVPGYLINQYAMSDWNGNLRVATTLGEPWAPPTGEKASSSAIYVLGQRGGSLLHLGKVEGLGKGERIYSVRFVGPVGYVVTFRQVDPLYTVDLSDPEEPRLRGELKIPGYSAYLHPAGDGRLIGIGQAANDRGRVSGTQISLFDTTDISNPRRIASYVLSGSYSEAEFDPHAFLYWPQTGTLVVPVQIYNKVGAVDSAYQPQIGAIVLQISGSTISEVGFLSHPATPQNGNYSAAIRRSLVIGRSLWTVSDGGLMATDIMSLTKEAFIHF